MTVVPSWKGRRRSCYSLCTWFQSLIREIASYLPGILPPRRSTTGVVPISLTPQTPLNDPPGFRWISRIRGTIFLLYIIISYVPRPKANPSPMIENNRALAVILDNRKYLLALFFFIPLFYTPLKCPENAPSTLLFGWILLLLLLPLLLLLMYVRILLLFFSFLNYSLKLDLI